MQSINKLGLKVAGITALVAASVFGLYSGGKSLVEQYRSDSPVAQGLTTPSPLAVAVDTDGDGLADHFEGLYGTDITKQDTDNDGEFDLQEITAGHDPVVAGTSDGTTLPTGSNVVNPQTHTQHYLASLPENASREEILNQTRLEAYINLNRGELLPVLPQGTIKTAPTTGKDAVSAYLNSIASTHNPRIHVITSEDIQKSFEQQLGQQPQAMDTIIAQLEENVRLLKEVATPTETITLHQKLVAASQALLDNAKKLRAIDNDFVGGLLASKNIDDLGTIFTEISTEIKALETKYALE